MVNRPWQLKFTKLAQKDAKKLAAAGLKPKTQELLEILKQNPFTNPPSYEKLKGDLQGYYSRRINIQHRLVYSIDEENKIVKVVSVWSRHGE